MADLRRAGAPRGRERLDRFLIEGLRLHERALRARAPLESVVVSRSFWEDASTRATALRRALELQGCRVEIAPDAIVDELTAGRSEGAVVGLVRMPGRQTLDDLPAATGGLTIVLACVEVEDPGNVGALVRTALAGGASGFAAVGISDPFHPRAARTSMGSLFRLPIVRYPALGPFLADLARHGFTTIAAVAEGGVPLPRLVLESPRLAILLGSEAFGLPDAACRSADRCTTVPMADGVDSYSVNAAAAVILYEIGRRGIGAE